MNRTLLLYVAAEVKKGAQVIQAALQVFELKLLNSMYWTSHCILNTTSLPLQENDMNK